MTLIKIRNTCIRFRTSHVQICISDEGFSNDLWINTLFFFFCFLRFPKLIFFVFWQFSFYLEYRLVSKIRIDHKIQSVSEETNLCYKNVTNLNCCCCQTSQLYRGTNIMCVGLNAPLAPNSQGHNILVLVMWYQRMKWLCWLLYNLCTFRNSKLI